MASISKGNGSGGGSSGAPSTIGYRVISCSSEDPQHPISAIQSSSIRSTGYQSAANPKYPIEFILDLGSVAEIDTIQFVSHQYKIASRLDLYVALEDQKFRALGSFQFSDNSFTDFKARELKSATLNGIRAQYIKISIPGCHANGSNVSNQIGLISLNIIGRGGSIAPSQLNKTIGPGQLYGNDLGSTMSSTNDLLEQLERQKKEAVAKEEFKKAESLKQQIDRLRRAYSQITVLQQQKNDAIAHEDYATAQRLKNEIDFLLRGEISQPSQPQQVPQQMQQPPQRNQQSFQTTSNQKQKYPSNDQPPPAVQAQQKRKAKKPTNSNKIPLNEVDLNDPTANLEDAIPTQPHRDESHIASDERPIHPSPSAFNDDDLNDQYNDLNPPPSKVKRAKVKNPADERPIHPSKDANFDVDTDKPSPKARKKPGPAPAQSGKDLATDPEELSPQYASEASLLIELFGQRPVACFFSHAWNLRKSAIQELGQMIIGLKDRQKEAFSRYCFIMRHRVQEVHKAVFQAAIENIMSTADALNLSTQNLGDCINQMITQLIPKVGCSQNELSNIACHFLLWLCGKDLYDIVVPIVMKPLKNQNQYLIALAQLDTLNDMIIDKMGVEKIPGLTVKNVMEFSVPFLEHPNLKVRNQAIVLVVTMNKFYGTRINQYYDKVNKNVKFAIDSAIEKFNQSLN